MAGGTARCRMLPDKGKTCVGVMIEGRRLPARGRMAARAVGPARAFVHIVPGMARDALGRRARPSLACMACEASNRPVGAGEGKAGRPVVEGQGLLPAVDRVAGLAILSQPSKVRVLPRVAGGACGRYAAEMPTGPMAPRARGPGMAAEQRIICQLVIEACLCKTHQCETSPVMLAVTGLAGLRPGIRLPVESQPAAYIGADSRVAGKALSVLRLAGKGFVARRAICFQPGMRTAQGPRRDQPFHDALGKGQMCGQCQPCNGKKAQPAPHQYICTAMMWMIAVNTRIRNSGRWNKCQRRNMRS